MKKILISLATTGLLLSAGAALSQNTQSPQGGGTTAPQSGGTTSPGGTQTQSAPS